MIKNIFISFQTNYLISCPYIDELFNYYTKFEELLENLFDFDNKK